MVSTILKLGETKLIFWSTGKSRVGRSVKSRVDRSVGKIKIVLFDFWGWYFFKNNIFHGKHRRKYCLKIALIT